MRRLLTPSTLVPCVIIAAVAVMVIAANLTEGRRSRRSLTTAATIGPSRSPMTTRDGLDARVAGMRGRLAANPDDVGAAVLLSDALLRVARLTGTADPSIEAEAALTKAARADPGNYDVLRAQGAVYLSQHRFREALTAAERCRELRPDDATNYGVIGDAHLELGDYDAAFAAFDEMMMRRPNAASYARVAYAREIQGNLPGALESMRLAAAASEGADLEGTAWYRSQVGELYLKLGKIAEAEQAFVIASHAFPDHPFAVSGYARILEATGKRREARQLLEDSLKHNPAPETYVRVGDLYEAEGRHDEARRSWALAEAAWREAPEPKSLARFLAERGEKVPEAVAIAEEAIRVRHDIFTEDALAWAYFKAGRLAEARAAIDRALRTGSKDPEIRRHAAAIHQAVPPQMVRR